MKKLLLTLLTLCAGTVAFAQLNASGEGFYRIMSSQLHYLTLQSERFTFDRTVFPPTIDMSAMVMVEAGNNYANIVSNPASVFYIKRYGDSGNEYDLQSQGLDTWEMSQQRFHLTIAGANNTNPYTMKVKGTYSGVSFEQTLGEDYTNRVLTAYGPSNYTWYITPVNSSDDNSYFGINPQFSVSDKFYSSFYASFAFNFASTGLKAYAVDSVDYKHAIVIIKEISGTVPAATPVLIECSSALPEANRLNLFASGGTQPKRNLLEGVYFNKAGKMESQTPYDENTMRVLGLASDGTLAFVKAPTNQRTVLANTAYLKVINGAPTEFKIMTRQQYDDAPEVTIKLNDATREYGDVNPTFTYTVSGGEVRGYIYPSCEATGTTNVGQYPITLNTSGIVNTKVNVIPGTLTITKAPLTVTAGEFTRMKGEANPDMSNLTYSGFKNGQGASVLSARPTATCSADRESPGGVYEVQVGGGISQNYDFKYVFGKLTVYDARVKVDDAERYYGHTNPFFSYSPKNVLTGQPVYTTDADLESGVGVYTVNMSRGSVENEWVIYESGKLTVKPAPVTVSFTQSDYTIAQGQPLPTFSLAYQGFCNGQSQYDALDELPYVVYAENAKKGIEGNYLLQIGGGHAKNGNYTLTYSTAMLHIVKADPVTLSADTLVRYYGEANPELTFKSEGADLQGTPELSCEATEKSPAGSYDIVISTGTVTNFNVTYKNAKLIVKPAPLTISAGEYTMQQGQEVPAFTISYEGFKNGETADTEGVFTTKPTLSCSAVSSSAPGEYAINISDAVAPNYEITYKPGKLVVTQAEKLTIMASNYRYKYGQGAPSEFRYSTSGPEMIGEPTLTCKALAHPLVGEYVIEVGIGTVKNYNVELINGTFKVDPADLYVSVGEYKRYTGQENPEFKLQYEGFVYGDSEMVITKKPTVTTTATKDSPAGEYEIVVWNDGESYNYNLIPVNGKLTIEVDPVGVTSLDADGSTFDVYTTTGLLVKKDATSLKGLAKGVYIVNGKKVIVK